MTRVKFVFLTGACVTAAFCAACWASTVHQPGRFIFLPGGDVGLGFGSFAVRLEWIEYAPWDPAHMDYPWWSIPWWPVFVALAVVMVACAWPRRPRPAEPGAAADAGGR